MKAPRFIIPALLITVGNCTFAQWKLSGNNLTGTEKFGSTNNQTVNLLPTTKQE